MRHVILITLHKITTGIQIIRDVKISIQIMRHAIVIGNTSLNYSSRLKMKYSAACSMVVVISLLSPKYKTLVGLVSSLHTGIITGSIENLKQVYIWV